MKNLWKRFAAAGLTAAMGISMLAGCGNQTAKLDGTKTAVTINDEAVSLGAVSFMARYQQAYMYQMYSMYFGTTDIFDQIVDESTEQTYGDQLKEGVLENIEQLVLVKQHAADYDIELSDADKAEIEKIAQAYIEENEESIREQIGASKEDVQYLLEIQKIQDLMRDPMVADVDTEVPDDEAQQTTLTYISIAKKTEADFTSEETTADESLSDESVSEEAISVQVDAANAELLTNAEKILSDIKASDNVAEANMGEIAAAVDETLTAASGQFTTNDPTDTTLDASIVEAAADMKDGELYDEVIDTDSYYYVFRLDKTFAEDETEAKKAEIVRERKNDAFNKLVEEWKEAATITVDDKVMATLLITDASPFTLGQDESISDESVADEATADSAAEEVAEESVAEESVADESPADESVADESLAEESVSDESAAE